ncbi:hypothetical protein L9H26_19155 [Morganella psychrotolerans]|uniref:Phage tail fibre adhesin Gp38 N-terminal domain-containing protein n=1 Tax=Morganella psychrotolerans TaxID=368603 RepID=A0A5M9QXA3_9GAMM|nr:hypothetical protein [Morganella psychrotolerans]KAA8713018.1 hypothetical protein F4V73_18050 [Morganella psychrotolerans]OBU01885.1 hypothetical protein AYY16_16860 [Morganella psychrotolerans]
MAVVKGNVGSSVVAEFGERSMLAAGAKAGLKPVFQMSHFVGKSAGFKLKPGHTEWTDYDDWGAYFTERWGYAKGAFGSFTGAAFFDGKEITALHVTNDTWTQNQGFLNLGNPTRNQNIKVTLAGHSGVFIVNVFKGTIQGWNNNSLPSGFINALKSGGPHDVKLEYI